MTKKIRGRFLRDEFLVFLFMAGFLLGIFVTRVFQ